MKYLKKVIVKIGEELKDWYGLFKNRVPYCRLRKLKEKNVHLQGENSRLERVESFLKVERDSAYEIAQILTSNQIKSWKDKCEGYEDKIDHLNREHRERVGELEEEVKKAYEDERKLAGKYGELLGERDLKIRELTGRYEILQDQNEKMKEKISELEKLFSDSQGHISHLKKANKDYRQQIKQQVNLIKEIRGILLDFKIDNLKKDPRFEREAQVIIDHDGKIVYCTEAARSKKMLCINGEFKDSPYLKVLQGDEDELNSFFKSPHVGKVRINLKNGVGEDLTLDISQEREIYNLLLKLRWKRNIGLHVCTMVRLEKIGMVGGLFGKDRDIQRQMENLKKDVEKAAEEQEQNPETTSPIS